MNPFLANMGLPMIVLHWPAMIAALVPVVILESLLVRWWAPTVGIPRTYGGVALANVVSTAVGVPIAWGVMFAMEMAAHESQGYLWRTPAEADLSWVETMVLFVLGSAWLPPSEPHLHWMIPAALAVLLIPSFLASVWLEWWIFALIWKEQPRSKIIALIWRINSVSYAIMMALVLLWLNAELTGVKPLAFEPGEEAQVDWHEGVAKINGVERKVQVFCMRLCHSKASFTWPYERATLEAFLDGHVRALAYFGGVPKRIAYDNLKSAVTHVGAGKDRTLNERFKHLRCHDLFDTRFCPLGSMPTDGLWRTSDQHRPVISKQASGITQRTDGITHIVDRLTTEDQVVSVFHL